MANPGVGPISDPDAGWTLQHTGWNRDSEAGLSARLTIANGFLGVSGEPPVQGPAMEGAAARTLVAGLFVEGRESSALALAKAPEWIACLLIIERAPALHDQADLQLLHRVLDLRRGVLMTGWRSAANPTVRVRGLSFASLADRSIALHRIRVDFEADVDATLCLSRLALDSPLRPEASDAAKSLWVDERTGRRLARAADAFLEIDQADVSPSTEDEHRTAWRWRATKGQSAELTRVLAYSHAQGEARDPARDALTAVTQARRLGWRRMFAQHEEAWGERWRSSDVEVEGDEESQRALRFAAYHLNSAANPEDDRTSIGARGLTGEDYFGHVFWETEVFLIPFFISTWPQAARALLKYRYHGLNAARAKAARLGWRGAFYAWESAAAGEETAPERSIDIKGDPVEIRSGRDEAHISADVAWATWRYWRATGDDTFLIEAGGEILFETARFWASRSELGSDGRRHIRGVEGPDEYHSRVDDNAFTNEMARWNIARALEAAALFQSRWPERWRELRTQIKLDDRELAQWRGVAGRLKTGPDPETGLYEQFAGYFNLERIDLGQYADRTEAMDILLGAERIQGSQVIKQADVVQLQAMAPELFDRRSALANFDYYERRCRHGSSLSMATHALVAARLGRTEQALDYFRRATAKDLGDDPRQSAGGVHLGTLGGLWQTAVLGFGGVSLGDRDLTFDPRLPNTWKRLKFPVQWRGRRLRIEISPNLFVADLEAGERMTIRVKGQAEDLEPSSPVLVRLPETVS